MDGVWVQAGGPCPSASYQSKSSMFLDTPPPTHPRAHPTTPPRRGRRQVPDCHQRADAVRHAPQGLVREGAGAGGAGAWRRRGGPVGGRALPDLRLPPAPPALVRPSTPLLYRDRTALYRSCPSSTAATPPASARRRAATGATRWASSGAAAVQAQARADSDCSLLWLSRGAVCARPRSPPRPSLLAHR